MKISRKYACFFSTQRNAQGEKHSYQVSVNVFRLLKKQPVQSFLHLFWDSVLPVEPSYCNFLFVQLPVLVVEAAYKAWMGHLCSYYFNTVSIYCVLSVPQPTLSVSSCFLPLFIYAVYWQPVNTSLMTFI